MVVMNKYFSMLLICLASFFLNFVAFAQEQENSTVKTETAQPPPSSSPLLDEPFLENRQTEPDNFQAKFMNMLFLLSLIIVFMLFASWMLKRLTRSRTEQINSASSIKVLETRYLSPRSTVYLIDVMGQGLIIAESHTGVTHLATIPLGENPNVDFSSKNTGKTFQV